MKRKNKILVTMKALTLAAATAVIAVFSSCRKEPVVGESASGTTDGVRVISVQFDNSTKATLSGVTPTFTNNDKIRVSNSEKSEECTVTVSGPSATFTTTLSGELTAIYPAAAADYTGSGPISSQAFKVPANQTGKVEDAIIAKATIASNSATFTGVTALFEITPPSTAKIITVTSLKKVESGSRTGAAADINTENTGKTVITVGDGSADLPGTIYVAFVPGVNLTDLSFDAGEDIGLKGIPTSKLGTGPDETAAKAKYTIDGTNWHPYVTIGTGAGARKWATMNIGATSPTDYGTYFAWGGTTGHALKAENLGITGTTISSAFVDDYDFSWNNCPYQTEDNPAASTSTKFTKYLGSISSSYKDASATDADANKTVLDLADDAAYANWGGPWRMPAGEAESNADFTALAEAASESYSPPQTIDTVPSSQGVYFYNGSGTAGVYFVDSSLKMLFFPAAGYGSGTDLKSAGSNGGYRSRSLNNTADPSQARVLRFTKTIVTPHEYQPRYRGYSVRPVSD